MNKKKQNTGSEGEDLACLHLQEKGYEIIEQNYRFGHGEIDIIAKDQNILVFVEVKTRNNLNFGMPETTITQNKRKQIRKIASAYLYEKEIKDIDCRIDVVAILLNKNEKPYINHIKNAF